MWRKGRWPAVLQQRNKEHVLLSAFVGLESAHFFSAFLPSYFTIRKFAHGDTEAMNSLYAGMVFALLFSVALWLVVSALLEDPLPLIFSAVVSGLMLVVYRAVMLGYLPNAPRRALGVFPRSIRWIRTYSASTRR